MSHYNDNTTQTRSWKISKEQTIWYDYFSEYLQDTHFSKLFKSEFSCDKQARKKINEDVLVLSLSPSSQITWYRSMYAFKNQIRKHNAEEILTMVDFSVAAIFSQHCRSKVHAMNFKAANLEYVIWLDKILGVNYVRYELVVLYCNWVMANIVGHNVTLKRDDYRFSLVNFNRSISLSAESFVFSLY